MSTGSTSAYAGACRKDIPYPSVSEESVPSMIDNLTTALYGDITKTVVDRRVEWNIPCDPNNSAEIYGSPREQGEGLLCYMMRALGGNPIMGVVNNSRSLDDEARVSINKILTGERVSAITVEVNELVGSSTVPLYSHKPVSSSFTGNGWITGVSEVTLGGNPIVAGTDYVFYPDRQRFYFIGSKASGTAIELGGYGYSNGFKVTMVLGKLLDAISTGTTTSPVPTAITSATVGSTSATFEFDSVNNMVFLKSPFVGSSLTASFKTNQAGVASIKWNSLGTIPPVGQPPTAGVDFVMIPAQFFTTFTSVTINGAVASPSSYVAFGGTVTFGTALPYASNVVVNGTCSDGSLISYTYNQFIGQVITLPTSLTSCDFCEIANWVYYDGVVYPTYNPFFYLSGNKLFLGDVFGAGGIGDNTTTNVTINASSGLNTVQFTISGWSGNIIYLPPFFEDVTYVKIAGTQSLVLFERSNQKVWFASKKNGAIYYKASFKRYEGKSIGGEQLEIVREVQGVMATTAGTGEYLSTMTSDDPTRNYLSWNQTNLGNNDIQLIDEDMTWIYEDYSPNAPDACLMGFTTEGIKPLTPKLPLAPLWPAARRNDTALMQLAFSPSDGFPYNSATYLSLDDGQRVGDSSIAIGSTISMSSNTTTPVRGVNGVVVSGPIPAFYAGSVAPRVMMACYKWFIVKLKTASNNAFQSGELALLCLHTINYETRTIGVTADSTGYTVAADLYKL